MGEMRQISEEAAKGRGEQARTSSGSTSPWGGPEPLGSSWGAPQHCLLTLRTCPGLVRY